MAGVVKTCVWLVFSCIHCLFWIPIIIVTVSIIWGYYVYVYLINITAAGEGEILEKPLPLRILLLIFAHILLFLQYTSFIKAIITKHSQVPQQYRLTQEQLRELDDAENEKEYLIELAKKLPVQMISRSGGVRYCPRCRLIKPDRCHHCSLCNRCVLKMDHHCPWINNCVGYSNYKFFFLFLFYTMALCLYIGLSSIYDAVRAWTHHGDRSFDLSWVRFNTVFLFFMCLIFASGVGFLLFFHVYLVIVNKTTLESGRTPDFVFKRNCGDAYHLGWRRNLQQIFGTNLFIAFLPLASSLGDGCKFPMGYKGRSLEEPAQDGRLTESDEDLNDRESTPLTVP